MAHIIKIIEPEPGINLDLTKFSSPNYGAGQHVRFYGDKGYALKIGGYKLIDPGTTEIIRNLYSIDVQKSIDVYYGRASGLTVTNFTKTGILNSTINRTPLGYVPNVNNVWSFDDISVRDANGAYIPYIVAVAAPNGDDINNSITGIVYWGPTSDSTPLVPLLSSTGSATLNNGTQVFVPFPSVTVDSKVIVSINTPNNSTPGFPYVADTMIAPGNGFFINSVGGTNDLSVVNYDVVEDGDLVGTATLSGGTVVVSNTNVRDDSLILISYNTPGSNTGDLSVSALVSLTSFTINSTNASDDSTVNYRIINFPNIYQGSATLTPAVGGSTATINIGGIDGLNIFADSIVLVSHQTPGGTMGKLYVSNLDIDPSVSFTIKSTSATDSSTVSYLIYNFPNTAGGVVSVGGGSFLFLYGNNGAVQWSARGLPNVFPPQNTSIIAGNKIVQGYPIRSGGIPGALFWSLDSLVRCLFNTNDSSGEGFTFDPIETNISIISPDSVVQYTSQFFWVGINQFYRFDGTVQKIPNNMCTNYFFRNLNYQYQQRVFGFLNPLYSEIWWGFPKFPATEVTNFLIYNYALNKWYVTELGRSCGISATSTFPYPLLADNQTIPNISVAPPLGNLPENTYGLWMHEFGFDRIQHNQTYSIPSYFTSNSFCLFDENPAEDRNYRIRRIEPDFKDLVGDMNVSVLYQQSPQSVQYESTPYTFNAETPAISMDEQGGIVSLKFMSNTVGGNYYMGKIIMQYEAGDPRMQD